MSKNSRGDVARTMASTGMSVLRTSSSRILGVVLVITSALLFLVAYVTGFVPFELASLVSFILGVALLAVELEPRVRISVAADSMLGYLRGMDSTFTSLGISGKATYVLRGASVKMAMSHDALNSRVELVPVGDGLYGEITEQVGDLTEKGYDFFKMWVSKALADNLSLSETVEVSRDEDTVKVSMEKPFVRHLCVDPFVNARVCCSTGCPLAAAAAQALAVSTGREVGFEGCTYDPRKQRAVTSLALGRSE
jgi:membrane-bound ClpP family serine protease